MHLQSSAKKKAGIYSAHNQNKLSAPKSIKQQLIINNNLLKTTLHLDLHTRTTLHSNNCTLKHLDLHTRIPTRTLM